MATITHAREDFLPVHSRVRWGPILGGVAVAFAIYFLLSLLGLAIGLSVTDDLQRDTLGWGAAIWAIITMVVAFFVGGWVTSRCTVGEDKLEAVLYGLILWGAMFLVLLWLVGSGVGMGFNAMMTTQGNGQAAGAAMADQPAAQAEAGGQQIARTATSAAWWSFIGTLLSMGAAVAGAVAGMGAGPRRQYSHVETGTATTAHRPAV